MKNKILNFLEIFGHYRWIRKLCGGLWGYHSGSKIWFKYSSIFYLCYSTEYDIESFIHRQKVLGNKIEDWRK